MAQAALALDALVPTGAPEVSELSDAELVARLVASSDSVDPARGAEVLRTLQGFAGLSTAEPAGVVHEGIDPETATVLLAAIELGRRLAAEDMPRFQPMRKLPAVAAYLALRYRRRDQEVMGAVYLSRRQRWVKDLEIFRGTLSRAAVEPRPILVEAVRVRAASIVLFHTHPSGDPSPSLEDLAFTRRMADAARAVGLELLDHLVVAGPTEWVSLRERDALAFDDEPRGRAEPRALQVAGG